MSINKDLIQEYTDRYGYNSRCFGDVAIITTQTDTWRISLTHFDGKNKYKIEHANKAGNRTRKMQFHFQRYAPDIAYIFDIVISRHQNYDTVYDEMFKIKELLETL